MLDRARESNGFASPTGSFKSGALTSHKHELAAPASKSFRYMRSRPTMVRYDNDDFNKEGNNNNNNNNPAEVRFDDGVDRFDVVVTDSGNLRRRNIPPSGKSISERGNSAYAEDGPGKKMTLKKPLEVSSDNLYLM